MIRWSRAWLLGVGLVLAAGLGAPACGDGRVKQKKVETTRSPKRRARPKRPPRPRHEPHPHAHEHPHDPGAHHHHWHPHPHLEGADGHHHPH